MNSKLVEDTPDDGVGEVLEILRVAVEGGGCRQDDRTGLGEGDDVPGMDEIPRGLARNNDELAPFLEENIGGAKDQILACACCDPSHRPHRAGDDDHAVKEGAPAGEGSIHRLLAVFYDAGRQIQFPDLLTDHLLGVGGEDEVDLMPSLAEMMQEPLQVDRATGSGGGKDEAHGERAKR